MIWIIYYVVSVISVTILAVYNVTQLCINSASIIPIFLIGLSVFQALYFYNNRSKSDFSSGNNSPLSETEWEILSVYMSFSYVFFIPLLLPFVIFFQTPIKALSLIIYGLAFVGGNICFRIKHGKEIKARLEHEKQELDEQKKKEELGIIR